MTTSIVPMTIKDLPTYQCQKKVQAAKIVNMSGKMHYEMGYRLRLMLPGPAIDPFHGQDPVPDSVVCLDITVSENYIHKHNPQIGGYYVLYEDGYESFSPADAFESGYSLI